MNEHRISLDLSKEPLVAPVLYLGQGDKLGTTLIVSIYDDGQVPTFESGSTVTLCMKNPGENGGYYEVAGTLEGNVATFTIDEEYAASTSGVSDIAYVEVSTSFNTTSTSRFTYVVFPSAEHGADPSSTYSNGINEAIERANEAADAAEAIVDYQVPLMSSTQRGGAKLGNGLEVGADERLGVKVDGTTIMIGQDGALHGASTYSLPTMSATTKGGAKLGQGLKVDSDKLSLGNLVESGTGAEVVTDGCAIYSVEGEGWATQDGTPTPDNPVEIEVARGRNLLDKTAMQDGWVLSNGEIGPYGNAKYATFNVGGNETYTFSATTALSTSSYILLAAYSGAPSTSTLLDRQVKTTGNSLTLTTPTGTTILVAAVYDYALIGDIQLELGSTPSPYVPYGHVGLEVQGKNLLPNYATTRTITGITFTVNDDGSIKANGTATAWTELLLNKSWNAADAIPVTPNAMYYLSGGVSNRAYVRLMVYNAGGTKIGDYRSDATQAITMPNDAVYATAELVIINGTALSEAIFRPMLERGSTSTPYQPYVHTTTPIPLPTKGFAASLPDGTADALTVDSAGRWEWTNVCDEAVFDGSSGKGSGAVVPSYGVGGAYSRHTLYLPNDAWVPSSGSSFNFRADRLAANSNATSSTAAVAGNAAMFPFTSNTRNGLISVLGGDLTTVALANAWLATNPVTVLYPLATSTTEHGYIDLPVLPQGATVSIPELEQIGVSWFVDGCEPIVEHISNERRRTEEALADVREAIADL